jgi:hypothetical protein
MEWDDGKSYIIAMKITLAPDEIPNGTIGATREPKDAIGLKYARFENGTESYCYNDEIEYA